MTQSHQQIWLSLLVLVTLAHSTLPFPFPVFRRNLGTPRVLQADTGYMKRSYGDPSVYAIPSRSHGSPWSYVAPFGAQAIMPPQTRQSPPVYGIPTNSLWTNALLQFDESAGRSGAKADYASPLADYTDDEDYDESVEESQDMADYGDAPSENVPAFDWGFIPALEDGPGPRYVAEERRETYKNLLLPYLLYSAMDSQNNNQNNNNGVRTPLFTTGLSPGNPQELDRGVHPQESRPSAGSIESNVEQEQKKRAFMPIFGRPRHETGTLSVANEVQKQLQNKTSLEVSTTTTSTTTSEPTTITESTTTPVPSTESPPIVKSIEEKDPMMESASYERPSFYRGQKEFAMLRPATENKASREQTLKAMTWPKALERDDKDEQKRQLRQLPLEADSTRHENIDSRRWPTVLEDVDDWLSAQLNDLKSHDQ